MKRRIRILSLAIVIAGLFVFPQFVSADEVIVESRVQYLTFSFRHDPEGCWHLVANGGSATIYDNAVDTAAGRISCTGTANMLFELTGKEVQARKDHPDLKMRIERPPGISNIDFSYFSYRFTGPGTMEARLKISPVIVKGTSLNAYVSGLTTVIPLVDSRYGRNTYTVYPLVGSPGIAFGFYSSSDPSQLSSPLIHPSQIKDRQGHFKSGTTINVAGTDRNAALWTIGKKGVLPFESAAMLTFFCPIKLVSYYDGEGSGSSSGAAPGSWITIDTGDGSDENGSSEDEHVFTLKLHRAR